jgi:hypothetical protein
MKHPLWMLMIFAKIIKKTEKSAECFFDDRKPQTPVNSRFAGKKRRVIVLLVQTKSKK